MVGREEFVTENAAPTAPAWEWSPVWKDDGEGDRLLSRQTNLTENERESIRRAAVEVLARCRAPEASPGQETGLVVGHVQSGKTLSFTSVAALASDNNYPLVVLLSGTTRPLTAQTVDSLRQDLHLGEPGGKIRLFVGETRNPNLTRQLNQLMSTWDQDEVPGFTRPTILIAVMKNARRLDALSEALSGHDFTNRPCLVIDDEADQHGLNTRVNEDKESSVYAGILRLRQSLPNHTYLQYTATPQANVLISVLDTLSPRFGWVLTPGPDYTGGAAFFSGPQDLIQTIPEDEIERPDHERSLDEGPPDSLVDAMRLFFVGVTVQAWLRSQSKPTQSLRSMLIHPSMKQLDHFKFKIWVDRIKDRWMAVLEDDANEEDRDHEIQAFERAYESLQETVDNHQAEPLPGFEDLVPLLTGAMRDTPPAWEVNSRDAAARWDLRNWEQGHSHILVGGENLGRGFRVEGLTVTYMPRGKGGGQVDTIEQRARFFGYKKSHLGLCRVFLDADVREIYTGYLDHEQFLMEKLANLAADPSRPMSDWRREMLLANRLKPTRPNVLPRGIYSQLKIPDWTVQSRPHELATDEWYPANRNLVDEFVSNYSFGEDPRTSDWIRGQRHLLANDVPLSELLEDLLVPYRWASRDAPGFSGIELVVGHFLAASADAQASVYMMSGLSSRSAGHGTRDRTVTGDNAVQPFQGPNPANGSRYPGDRRIHAPDRVTLQIHNINLRDPNGTDRQNLPVLAVWVPANMRKGVFFENPRPGEE